MLENAMSNLRINLPDQSLKPSQHIPIITSILSNEKEEKVLYNNNIRIEVEVEEKVENENLSMKKENKAEKDMKDDREQKEVEGKEEKNVMSVREKKMKLDNIDNILGFDGEKDKNDYFAGQLRGFTGNNNNYYNNDKNKNNNDNSNDENNNNKNNNINNKNYDSSNGKSNNHEKNKIESTKNIFCDNFVSSNPPSFNPNYTENRKYLPGVHNPPAYGNRNNGNGKHENGPKIVFAGQTSMSARLTEKSNNNHNEENNCNDNNAVTFNDINYQNKNENENTAASAPPFVPRNQVLVPSVSTTPPSSNQPTSSSSSSLSHIDKKRIQNSQIASNNLKSDLILQQEYEIKRKFQSQKFNEIQYEIASSTNIRSFPLFSPPKYPPEGSAIRALREKQKEEKQKEEKFNNSSNIKKKNLEISSNYVSTYMQNKENILPDMSSPVHDRLEYLNNMKKMREKMTTFSN